MNEVREERIMELLTEALDRTLERVERKELDGLLAEEPGRRADDFELAASAAFLAFQTDLQPLPIGLADTLINSAREYVPALVEDEGSETLVLDESDTIIRDRGLTATVDERPPASDTVLQIAPMRSSRWIRYGGWAAAAASFALVAWAATRTPEPTPLRGGLQSPIETPLSPGSARTQLLQQRGVIRAEWQRTEDSLALSTVGDVVWDPKSGSGFMRFSGLAKNDPRRNQYQLWIFDGTRDAAHPVDGGVFDIDSETGDVVVPIDAKIKIDEATMFAVTVERPGGVVVSKRERIVVLAKLRG